MMNRRDALARVALLMGGTISAPTMVAFLEGCGPSGKTTTASAFTSFSPDELSLVSEIAEVIIPRTDTPGAKDAGVGPFIEMMLKDCYAQPVQESFLKGLSELADKNFLAATPEERTRLLTELEKQTRELVTRTEAEKRKQTDTGQKDIVPPVPFFNLMKELTLLGYFSSEQGATKALDYVPVPGSYEGCIDLKPGQKAWAMS